MVAKCPGSQFFSQPHPESIKCVFCGAEIEIWSDEVKAKCPKCKKTVMRDQGASCLDWCKYAKQCLGDKLYKEYIKNKEAKNVKEKNTRRTK